MGPWQKSYRAFQVWVNLRILAVIILPACEYGQITPSTSALMGHLQVTSLSVNFFPRYGDLHTKHSLPAIC